MMMMMMLVMMMRTTTTDEDNDNTHHKHNMTVNYLYTAITTASNISIVRLITLSSVFTMTSNSSLSNVQVTNSEFATCVFISDDDDDDDDDAVLHDVYVDGCDGVALDIKSASVVIRYCWCCSCFCLCYCCSC